MGAAGPQGLQGVQGDVGAAGPQGAAGRRWARPARRGCRATWARPARQALTALTARSARRARTALPALTARSAQRARTAPPALTARRAQRAQRPAGADGAQGPAGPQGATGPAGTSGLSDYAYVYNLAAQTVPLEAAVTFDQNGVMTAGITHALNGAGITLLNAGSYKVAFSVSGTEPNQMALFVDGILAPGTVYASGAGTQQNTGQGIVTVAAGATLTLRNHTSAAAVGLATPVGGTQPSVNASIAIERLG